MLCLQCINIRHAIDLHWNSVAYIFGVQRHCVVFVLDLHFICNGFVLYLQRLRVLLELSLPRDDFAFYSIYNALLMDMQWLCTACVLHLYSICKGSVLCVYYICSGHILHAY